MIILMQWRYLRGPFCRDCGLQAVHRMTTQTLWQGWWGIFSLFLGAPFALIANFLVSRRFKALPEPAGQPVHVAPPQPGGAYPPPGSTPPSPPPPDPTA